MSNKSLIILIEDSPIQQRILSDMLKDDFIVQAFRSCQSARLGLRQLQSMPALILCDITLPDGNGLDLRREMLEVDQLASCPFIFLSSHDDDLTKQHAAQLGIDDFLSKPIKKESLLNTLNRTIRRSAALHENLNHRLDRQLTDILQPDVPPLINGHRFYLAHRDTIAGGGDFVFHMKTPQADYILVGDVMGHGAPAKFFLHAYTGYLYGLFRAFRHHNLLPRASDFLNMLNQALAEDEFLKRWLLTCMVLCIPAEASLTLANAGHVLPWLKSAGRVGALGPSGPMPGLLNDMFYRDETILLKRGDRLYLATDGVTLDSGILQPTHGLPMEQAAEALIARNADENDDATIIIIERV